MMGYLSDDDTFMLVQDLREGQPFYEAVKESQKNGLVVLLVLDGGYWVDGMVFIMASDLEITGQKQEWAKRCDELGIKYWVSRPPCFLFAQSAFIRLSPT